MQKQPSVLESVFDNPEITNIYSFSDIHGDIEALIIDLCDCAEVIKKSDTSPDFHAYLNNYKNYDDIINQTNGYDHLMGFEWCGNNSYIVIVGDVIDGCRNFSIFVNDGETRLKKRIGEFPYEELKILLFLNALNIKAKEQGGRIIRLAGNHELLAFDIYANAPSPTQSDYINRRSYSSPYALAEKYGDRYTRKDFFTRNLPGAPILYGDDMGVITKIHDFVFVHGGLAEKFMGQYNDHRVSFNKLNTNFYNYVFHNDMIHPSIDDNEGLLWDRKLGTKDNDNPIETDNKLWIYRDTQLCHDLYKYFRNLCYDSHNNEESPNCHDNMRLVIGHCPQSLNISKSKIPMNAYSYSDSDHAKYSTFTVPVVKHISDIGYDLIHGITVECGILNKKNDPSLFRVDVGVSKAFDTYEMSNDSYVIWKYIKHMINQKLKILDKNILPIVHKLCINLSAKVPQILHIHKIDTHKYDIKVKKLFFDHFLFSMNRKYLIYDEEGIQSRLLMFTLSDYYFYYDHINKPDTHEITDKYFLQMVKDYEKIYAKIYNTKYNKYLKKYNKLCNMQIN